MRRLNGFLGVGLVVVALVSACSENEIPIGEVDGDSGSSGEDGASTAGARSEGGRGGSIGDGDPAGRGSGGSKASAGGTSSAAPDETIGGAGSGGREPIAGGGGRAPAAGVGGRGPTAGSGGGAIAGSGGACEEPAPQEEPVDFSHCSESPMVMGESTCSQADTRAALRCGEPGSQFGPDCCMRERCDDGVCPQGYVCIPRMIQAPNMWFGSLVESCSQVACLEPDPLVVEPMAGSCYCGMTADLDWGSYCVKSTEDTDRFECDIAGRSCEELEQWMGTLDHFIIEDLEQFQDVFPNEYCRDKIIWAIENQCNGHVPVCECDWPGTQSPSCTTARGRFCSDALGCALEDLKTPGELCSEDRGRGVYTECDDRVRVEWLEGGENDFELTFDRSTSALTYGVAGGYVTVTCELPTQDTATISTGERPASEGTGCRSCTICPNDEHDDELELPECALDQQGRVVLPE